MGLAECSERWFYRICTIFMFCICGYMILTQGFAKQKKMLDDSNIDNCKICYSTARLHPEKTFYYHHCICSLYDHCDPESAFLLQCHRSIIVWKDMIVPQKCKPAELLKNLRIQGGLVASRSDSDGFIMSFEKTAVTIFVLESLVFVGSLLEYIYDCQPIEKVNFKQKMKRMKFTKFVQIGSTTLIWLLAVPYLIEINDSVSVNSAETGTGECYEIRVPTELQFMSVFFPLAFVCTIFIFAISLCFYRKGGRFSYEQEGICIEIYMRCLTGFSVFIIFTGCFSLIGTICTQIIMMIYITETHTVLLFCVGVLYLLITSITSFFQKLLETNRLKKKRMNLVHMEDIDSYKEILEQNVKLEAFVDGNHIKIKRTPI